MTVSYNRILRVTEFPNSGWAKAHPAHLVAASLDSNSLFPDYIKSWLGSLWHFVQFTWKFVLLNIPDVVYVGFHHKCQDTAFKIVFCPYNSLMCSNRVLFLEWFEAISEIDSSFWYIFLRFLRNLPKRQLGTFIDFQIGTQDIWNNKKNN